MAVLDFVSTQLDTSGVIELARGDTGSMLDIQARTGSNYFFLVIPDVSTVLLGTNYGQQGTEKTGTLEPGGVSGPTYYAY